MSKAKELLNVLDEMARIGKSGQYDYRLYSEPLGNPSFHIVTKDFEIVVKIKGLVILEVKSIGKSKFKIKKGDKLPTELKTPFLILMNKTIPGGKIKYKEFLVSTWNVNNPKYLINLKDLDW